MVARIETGATNAALEHQWIADDLSKVAEARDLNLERRADLEQARDILNDVHVELGTLLERENVLRRDGVLEAEPVSERFHYQEDAVRAMEGTIRQEMRADGLSAQQIEDREWEVVSRAERRIETEQRAYLEAHPELLARPTDVIDRSEPYRETITDVARASAITREVDRIMEARDVRTPVADAVTDDLRARYPDIPTHLARGLGATYAAVVEIRDTEAINQVRRETELREGLGVGTRDERLATRDETAPESDRTDRFADEIARVLDHERAGSCPRPSRPRWSGTLSARRSRGCWTVVNSTGSHPAMPMRWNRFSRTVSTGSMSPRSTCNPMPRRPTRTPCARWSMNSPMPNTKTPRDRRGWRN